MERRRADLFDSIRSEGGLLPSELLARLARFDPALEGLSPEAYGLLPNERLREAVSRSWNRLRGAWIAFTEALAQVPPDDPATGLTRDRWLSVLFQELGYGRLPVARGIEVAGKSFPISHEFAEGATRVPIHLVGAHVPIGERSSGIRGAASASPHALVQELLNLSDERLWGVVTNGRELRLLRDNRSLTRQAYVEFDLERMMAGEVYADFVVLWLALHVSRVAPTGAGEGQGGRPETCWLERWSQLAQAEGTRALDALRQGVEEAIQRLGEGFLAHPRNQALHAALASGALPTERMYRQLLRLCYRLLFLFVAESRGLLLGPKVDAETRRRYDSYYSVSRLRRLAERRRGGPHGDLWDALRLAMRALGKDGLPVLGLPALGSFLWRDESMSDLLGCELSNEALLAAIRALGFTHEGKVLRPVDYKNLGAEELGSIYESLLELHPRVQRDARRFELDTAAGNERKTTGSYYTPSSLIQCLLDTALEPVIAEKVKGKKPEAAVQALLDLKVVDPACGSGHFLIAAAHRIARRVAALRTGESEPAPEALRTALRDVIGHCLYGVDLNEMAVELCKVSLWMEALEPGKPLSFLEHRILRGNSLLGTTPRLLEGGLPDEAFTLLEGDDRKFVTALKKRNKQERERRGQTSFDFGAHVGEDVGDYLIEYQQLEALPDAEMPNVREKEARWERLAHETKVQRAKLVAHAWCSAFVAKKKADAPPVVTNQVLWDLRESPERVDRRTVAEVERLAREYDFFHWHLAFPHVFPVEGLDEAENKDTGWSGGFDVVLGNPPWERVKLQEQEFFATRSDVIAKAPNAAARKKLIAGLKAEEPELWEDWIAALREADAQSHFMRQSGRYPLCGRGDVNTYALFAELNRSLMGAKGRVGCIVPGGLATDDTTKDFFGSLVRERELISLYHFENEEQVFPSVHHAFRFCLLSLARGRASAAAAALSFYARRVAHLADRERHFTLTPSDFELLNPNTRTCPTFRWRRDAEINKAIYRTVPVLQREGEPAGNPWSLRFMAMLHMANDSDIFRTRSQLELEGWHLQGNIFERQGQRYIPLLEVKMVHHFDHRFGTYEGQTESQGNQGKLPELDDAAHADPHKWSLPDYWVPKSEVDERLAGRWDRGWLLGWRDICRSTDQRTLIAALVPRSGCGDTFLLMLPGDELIKRVSTLYANLCAFVLDYAARQKVGGTHLKYHVIKQLPVLPPSAYDADTPWHRGIVLHRWILPRVLELTYTAWDLEPFAKDSDYGGPPFRWDPGRRTLLRAELDAAYFHLYGIARDDVDYILETFHTVKKNDLKAHGEYKTKRLILERYDAMTQASETGTPYQTVLDPPPADPRIAHPPCQPSR